MEGTLLQGYLLAEAVLIGISLLASVDSWTSVICRVLASCAAVAVVVVGVRRHRPPGAAAYWLFALGVLFNITGGLVEKILAVRFGPVEPPTLADLFWLATYPPLIAGMAVLVRRREARDWSALIDSSIITLGVGLLAWVFLIRPQAVNLQTALAGRMVLTAYPLGDLVVIALMVRLLLGGGTRSLAFRWMIAAILCLLGADLVWAVAAQTEWDPGPLTHQALTGSYQIAYALIGAAALHPSVREVALSQARDVRFSLGLLVGLALASLIAPALLLFETLHGQIVDGHAIAISSGAVLLLVMVRMAGLVRRFEERTRALAERDRSARRVLETVNQGLLRVSGDGAMDEERSAIVDRWLGAFSPGTRFADHLSRFDGRFAEWFRVGHDAWMEGTLPAEVCLAQLPQRLRIGGRSLTVSYLPMGDDPGDKGLLLVINDVSDRVRLEQQEIEQRELLAMSHGLTRDRAGVLALLDELGEHMAALEAPAADPADQRRRLLGIREAATRAGLTVVAQLSQDADGQLEDHPEAAPAAVKALRDRWLVLTGTAQALMGHRFGDLIELPRRELDLLDHELERGLPAARAIERIRAWRREAGPRREPARES
jgi:hypothetical protein